MGHRLSEQQIEGLASLGSRRRVEEGTLLYRQGDRRCDFFVILEGLVAILEGPDKKIYVVCGNFVTPPADLLPTSPHRNYADDLAMPRAEDGNGFGAGKKPPGGFVCRMDPDGKNQEQVTNDDFNNWFAHPSPDGRFLVFVSYEKGVAGHPENKDVSLRRMTLASRREAHRGPTAWLDSDSLSLL